MERIGQAANPDLEHAFHSGTLCCPYRRFSAYLHGLRLSNRVEVGPERQVPQKDPDCQAKIPIQCESREQRDARIACQSHIELWSSCGQFGLGRFRIQAFRLAGASERPADTARRYNLVEWVQPHKPNPA